MSRTLKEFVFGCQRPSHPSSGKKKSDESKSEGHKSKNKHHDHKAQTQSKTERTGRDKKKTHKKKSSKNEVLNTPAPELEVRQVSDQFAVVLYNGNGEMQGHVERGSDTSMVEIDGTQGISETTGSDDSSTAADSLRWSWLIDLYYWAFAGGLSPMVEAHKSLTEQYAPSWATWHPKTGDGNYSLKLATEEEKLSCHFLHIEASHLKDVTIQKWLLDAAILFSRQSEREGQLEIFMRSSDQHTARFQQYDIWIRYCQLSSTIKLGGYVVIVISYYEPSQPRVVGAIEIERYYEGMLRDPVVSPPDFLEFFKADKLNELEFYQTSFKNILLKKNGCEHIWCLRDIAVQAGLEGSQLERDLMMCFKEVVEPDPVPSVTFVDFRAKKGWWEDHGFECRVYGDKFCYAKWSLRSDGEYCNQLLLPGTQSGVDKPASDDKSAMEYLEGSNHVTAMGKQKLDVWKHQD
ncbi:hypothetical protein PG987_016635 [Apiospora arundinis]